MNLAILLTPAEAVIGERQDRNSHSWDLRHREVVSRQLPHKVWALGQTGGRVGSYGEVLLGRFNHHETVGDFQQNRLPCVPADFVGLDSGQKVRTVV